MRYFSHDTNAITDELMLQLRLEHGLEAVAVYWAILEYIYGEEEPFPFGEDRRETKSVLYKLGISFEQLKTYLLFMCDINLLLSRKYRDANYHLISSLRAEEAIEAYKARAETARQNGKKGGRPKNPDGNPEKTQSVSPLVPITKPNPNQQKKLTKTKTKTKRVGFDKQNQTLPASADAVTETAPRSGFDEMTRAERETILGRINVQELERGAVTCPEEIREQVRKHA